MENMQSFSQPRSNVDKDMVYINIHSADTLIAKYHIQVKILYFQY